MATSQTPRFAVDCQPPSVRTREVASYVLYVGDTRRRSGWRQNSIATFASKKNPSASATGTAACARDSTMSDCARTASTTAWIAARPVSWRRNIESSCSLLVLRVHPAGFPPQKPLVADGGGSCEIREALPASPYLLETETRKRNCFYGRLAASCTSAFSTNLRATPQRPRASCSSSPNPKTKQVK